MLPTKKNYLSVYLRLNPTIDPSMDKKSLKTHKLKNQQIYVYQASDKLNYFHLGGLQVGTYLGTSKDDHYYDHDDYHVLLSLIRDRRHPLVPTSNVELTLNKQVGTYSYPFLAYFKLLK